MIAIASAVNFTRFPLACACVEHLPEFISRLGSVVPLISHGALPEVVLPSDFEKHCPGGLSALVAKTRALMKAESRMFTVNITNDNTFVSTTNSATSNSFDNTISASSISTPTTPRKEPKATKGEGSMGVESDPEQAGKSPDNKKRQRCRGKADPTLESSNSRGLDGFDGFCVLRDDVVGIAAAIAVFGWRSAYKSSVAATKSSKNGDGRAGAGGAATEKTASKNSKRLSCALCNRRLVTDNFLNVETGPPSPLSSAGGGCPGVVDVTDVVDAASNDNISQTLEASYVPGSINSAARVGSSGCAGESEPSGKRRRLSGGGTPLKAMDLAAEHRSYCPWATVHPDVEG